jgi:hypothetical protein
MSDGEIIDCKSEEKTITLRGYLNHQYDFRLKNIPLREHFRIIYSTTIH